METFALFRFDGRPGYRLMDHGDQQLVRRVLAHEEAAYALFQSHAHRVFEQVWAKLRSRYRDVLIDADDLRQSVEMHLVKDNFRVLRTFSGGSRLSTWLYVVTLRHVTRHANNVARTGRRESAELVQEPADAGTDPEVRAIRSSEKNRVREALLALNEEERVLIAMFYEQGLDASGVARVLGISAAGVRMRKKRLLARLEGKLKGSI